MARQYLKQKRGQMVTIHGFDEMIELLDQLEKRGVEEAAGQVFDECCEIIESSMDSYTAKHVPPSLKSKLTRFKVHRGNIFMFAYGWDRNKDPEDFMKVCYLNYGTPRRYTNKDGERVQIGGKWVTLSQDRGRVEARGFISNAKRSAGQKINAKKKRMLKDILGGAK